MSRVNQIYSEDYKLQSYFQWYNSGKPTATQFQLEIKPTSDGNFPTIQTLHGWIKQWKEDCKPLDERIYNEIMEETVASKVEMIRKQLGETKILRKSAYDYLVENVDELSPSTATRLWIESARLERELSGIPEALEKMIQMDDKNLIEEITELISESEIKSIEQIDAD